MGLVSIFLAMLPRVWHSIRALSLKLLMIYAGIGVIIALHWLCFYGAIKLSNVSVAVSCLSLGSFFAAVIEPALTGRKHVRREFFLGILAIPGVLLLVDGVPLNMRVGILVGVASAFLSAFFSALNKRYIHSADAEAVTLIEMCIGTVSLSLIATIFFGIQETFKIPSLIDFLWLLSLAIVFTLLPFIISLRALRHTSAFSTQMALNLEPVYAICIAALWFKEYRELDLRFYLGASIIFFVVALQPILQAWNRKAEFL